MLKLNLFLLNDEFYAASNGASNACAAQNVYENVGKRPEATCSLVFEAVSMIIIDGSDYK